MVNMNLAAVSSNETHRYNVATAIVANSGRISTDTTIASGSNLPTFTRVLAQQRIQSSASPSAIDRRQATVYGLATVGFTLVGDVGATSDAAVSDPLAGLPGALPADTSGLSAGKALLAHYPALGQFPTDAYGTIDYGSATAIPGMAGVSSETGAYWAQKLGGNFANIGNPDPAELLAQWLYHQEHGIEGTAMTPKDLEAGLAYAWSYAQAAGVSQQDLQAAQANVIERGGIEGSQGYDLAKASQYFLANAGLEKGRSAPGNAAEYLAMLRRQTDSIFPSAPVGSNITYGQVADALATNWGLADSGKSTAALGSTRATGSTTSARKTNDVGSTTTAGVTKPATATKASKIVALKVSIAHWTQLVAAQKAKGNGRTAARDQKVLDRYRKQLAALTS